MSLVKLPLTVTIPEVPAVPEVPYRPARTVCSQTPAPGRWENTQEVVRIRVPENGGVQLPPGTVSTTIVEVNGVMYLDALVVSSRWVQTGPPGPVVCVNYPEQKYVPAVPGVPERVVQENVFDWNGGANSIAQLDGDVSLTFTMPSVFGVVVGLTTTRAPVPPYSRLTHAFSFHQTSGGGLRWNVMEGGIRRTGDASYNPSDHWEIRRVGEVVTYYRNNQIVYTSRVASNGTLSTGASLYATGDTIP